MKIRGVNLGNWLVLEKWMHPALFSGVFAQDETDLSERLPPELLRERLKAHRDGYITLTDFKQIAAMGMNLVRLPVPYFVFGDCPPYVGCIEYVDRALDYAQKTGLRVLLDLHTAPGSQNGFDNGGICGVCRWHTDPAHIDATLSVLERLAARYKNRAALYGIELLNEPVSEEAYRLASARYKPSDPARAEGSGPVPSELLRSFYLRGYEVLRRHLDEDRAVVLHDGFRLREWTDFMRGPSYRNVVFDVHVYLDMLGTLRPTDSLSKIAAALEECAGLLSRMRQHFPILVGEWSLANQIPGVNGLLPSEKALVYRTVADLQRLAFEKAADGWIFWSWKLPADAPGWSLCDCVLDGWFPKTVQP